MHQPESGKGMTQLNKNGGWVWLKGTDAKQWYRAGRLSIGGLEGAIPGASLKCELRSSDADSAVGSHTKDNRHECKR